MNNKTIDNLTFFADTLSAQFGPNCEVAVYDLNAEIAEESMIYIVNGHVTGRKTGSAASQIVLESMEKLKEGESLVNKNAYRTKTSDGRILKSSTVYFNDETGNTRYLIAINYDITNLLHINENLEMLIGSDNIDDDSENDTAISIPGTVGDLLDDLLIKSTKLIGKEPALMTKKEKIRAIRFLNDSGAFLIMKSGDRIAEFFGLSKYTLYSYAEINKPH